MDNGERRGRPTGSVARARRGHRHGFGHRPSAVTCFLQILTNQHYTTNGRTLNQLDSGEKPSFMTVDYDKWSANNNAWLSHDKRFTDRKQCDDGDTYNFVIQ
jgi:hypothetical protein